ncbi:MAG TPA: EscR/YscR/HrcR family type III secretion system export apparatus protein [Luteimonas sp.]|nr:EscR/YscR/HrcR family type III secretion system export apparatus protein [Luteimonas sp.]HRP72273.1 EscR/YscR/HrcR family type III secretion system export apparatus protein [Luteimonas sp.]
MDLSSYSPALVLVVIVALALAPFVAVMVTSFTKIVVVLSLLRNALGLQQVPPNVVINGLAIVLSIYVMYPVILDTYDAVTAHQQGKPVPASVQRQVDERQRAQAARAQAQAQRAAERAQARQSQPADAASAAQDPPPASPAAADALRAEAEARARAPDAGDGSGLFDNVSTGSTPAPAAAPMQAEVVVPASAAPPPRAQPGSDGERLLAMIEAGKEPLRTFLIRHANDRERGFFLRSAQSLLPPERRDSLTVDDFIVVIPAFTVSELTTAFQIGFLIFLPFLIIDLVVANILLALGMMMMSPTTVSLPFKLLLFVLIDGWAKLVHGLVLTYTP